MLLAFSLLCFSFVNLARDQRDRLNPFIRFPVAARRWYILRTAAVFRTSVCTIENKKCRRFAEALVTVRSPLAGEGRVRNACLVTRDALFYCNLWTVKDNVLLERILSWSGEIELHAAYGHEFFATMVAGSNDMHLCRNLIAEVCVGTCFNKRNYEKHNYALIKSVYATTKIRPLRFRSVL